MRRLNWSWAVAVGIILLAPASGWAQAVNGFGSADPFFLYYGFYLPNQAYQAAQPRPEDTINANAASRQVTALRDRGEFSDQFSFGGNGNDEGLDFGPYSSRGGGRGGRTLGAHVGNVRGTGPAGYYNRTDRYFPGMVAGRGPNKNIAVMRGVRRGGGMGMPSMPGPR